MRYRFALPLFATAFLLQSTVASKLKILGVAPNLILCLVILLSFLYDTNQGLALGVVFGLLQDLCFGQIIGPTAISYFLVAITIKQLRIIFYRDNVFSVFLTTIIGTALFITMNWVINTVFMSTYTLMYVLKLMPILMGYHFVIMIIFYLIRGRMSPTRGYKRYYAG